jgi:hypothetical protein
VHSRVLSDSCFPLLIGLQANLLQSKHSILDAENISILSIVVDYNGSDIFGSTTIRSPRDKSITSSNFRVHSRVLSESYFPLLIGLQANLLQSKHSILHAENISISSIAVDHNGSDIFGNTTIRSNQETSQSFVLFLDSEQHHDSIIHYNQGGSGHRMSNCMPTSSNVTKYHKNELLGGLAGIHMSPPINWATIAEDVV